MDRPYGAGLHLAADHSGTAVVDQQDFRIVRVDEHHSADKAAAGVDDDLPQGDSVGQTPVDDDGLLAHVGDVADDHSGDDRLIGGGLLSLRNLRPVVIQQGDCRHPPELLLESAVLVAKAIVLAPQVVELGHRGPVRPDRVGGVVYQVLNGVQHEVDVALDGAGEPGP